MIDTKQILELGYVAKIVNPPKKSKIVVPKEMGTPRADQLQGSIAEQLAELSGRVCYDSLGSGRSSTEYHKHIQEVNHGSVYEHFNFCLLVNIPEKFRHLAKQLFAYVSNRPGVLVELPMDNVGNEWYKSDVFGKDSWCDKFWITLNTRSVMEWLRWDEIKGYRELFKSLFLPKLGAILDDLCPNIGKDLLVYNREVNNSVLSEFITLDSPPQGEFISMYMAGSRCWSHEQIRHGDQTAISQRSSRYCDENESHFFTHPWHKEISGFAALPESELVKWITRPEAMDSYRQDYKLLVDNYSSVLQKVHKIEGTNARKIARGAARFVLPNALSTDMIFSASISQWKVMLGQRLSIHADAEIRCLFTLVLPELKKHYPEEFKHFRSERSSDKIGHVLCIG